MSLPRLIAASVTLAQSPSESSSLYAWWLFFRWKEKLKGGIDLVGGSSFIVEIQPGQDEEGNPLPVNEGAIEQAKATLSKRLSNSGLSDNLMQPLGENRLIIEMPGVGPERRDEIRETIETTARLLLKKVHPNSSQIIAQIEAGTKTLEPGYQGLSNSSH
jgi:SecD/SecF fusion protein